MLAFELSEVTKRFPGRTALSGVSLELSGGSTLGLLGPNGAGKTTALRTLLGFARPSSGTVRLQGLDPFAQPLARQGVGYLPERLGLPRRTSVGGFLALHARLAGLAGREVEREVDAICELTGVADRRRDRIGGLSKGLTQRVGFAQALIARPRLVVLDEPTSGLDPIGMRDARDWIVAARERGASVLVSSHVLSEVERTCERVAILAEGRMIAEGRVEELLAEGEQLEDAFVRLLGRTVTA